MHDTTTEGLERLDRMDWILLVAALLPASFMAPTVFMAFMLPFIGLLATGHRRSTLPDSFITRAGAFTAVAMLIDYAIERDGVVAFTGWFAAMAAFSLFSGKGLRSLARIHLFGFLILLVVATRTLELDFLLYLTVFSVSLVASALREQQPEVIRPGNRLRYLAAAALFVLVSAVVAVPIFFILPRAPFVMFNPVDMNSITGFGDEVKLGDMVSVKKSSKLFMRVYAPGQQRWRGLVLDRYDGKTWIASASMGQNLENRAGQPARIPRKGDPPLDQQFIQDFVIEPYMNRAIFACADPVAVQSTGFSIAYNSRDCLSRTGDIRYQKVSYRVWSRLPKTDPAALKASRGPVNESFSMKMFRNMPQGLPRLRKLAADVAGRFEGWYDKARVIEGHLQENYSYTLDLPGVREGDPVEAFLFEHKRGHCEYFASAMVLMCRSQGIPARMVTGFAFGEYNQYGKYYTVREQDAHAWVEAYLPGVGWTEFDPTPASAQSAAASGLLDFFGLSNNASWLQMKAWLDSLDVAWQRDVISYSSDSQQQFLSKLIELFDNAYIWYLNDSPRVRKWVRDRRWSIAGLLALVLVASLAGGRRRVARMVKIVLGWFAALWVRRQARQASRPETEPFYRELNDVLAAGGHPRRPEWTPTEYAREVARALPSVSRPLFDLTELYCRAVFGARKPSPSDRTAAAACIDEIKTTLARVSTPKN